MVLHYLPWFMADQETGGERRPLKRQYRAAPLAIRKNERQRITKAKRPSRLLLKPRVFVNRLTKGPRRGSLVVLRRVGKAGYPLQVLYVLERSTKIQARFGFRKTVERTVARRLSKNFGMALAAALRTARR